MKDDPKLGELRAYACGIKGMDGSQIINARSRGKAKVIFWYDCDMDFPFILITCRVHGPVFTSDAFVRNAIYRNIPFAYVGMRVHLVGVGQGIIVSHNSSANLNVLFDDGQVQNCHPNWMMKYFNDAGRLVAEFGKGVTP